MIGYVYKTTNQLNGRMYIGKHQATEHDLSYYGSGKIINRAIKKYGIENFTNEIIYKADSLEELNEAEKRFISEYKGKYGRFCYNLAKGGDGGDTTSNLPEEEHKKFIEKMTQINRTRCSSAEFKAKLSKATTERYKDPEVRRLHSLKVKEAWKDPELRKRHGAYIHQYFQEHKKDGSYMFKECAFELNGQVKIFKSVKDLRTFLIDEYQYNPDRRLFKKLMKQGAQGIPFVPFRKNLRANLKGMLIYYTSEKSVETKADECKPVGDEISTSSKCKTECSNSEEIVQ